MHLKHLFAVGAAAAGFALLQACDLPKWDADFNVPLPSQRIRLDSAFGVSSIPPGASADISFPDKRAGLDESLGDLLKEVLAARLIATITTTVPFDGQDTVFVAGTSADLTNPNATRIALPMQLQPATLVRVDTISVTAAAVAMLKARAEAGDSLHVQMRGRMTYPGPGTRNLTPTDSVGVRLELLIRIPISK